MVVTRTELTQIVDQVNKKFDELERAIKEVKVCGCATDKKSTKTSKKAS